MSLAVSDPSHERDDLFFEAIVRGYADVEKNPRFLRRDWLADEVGEALKDPVRRFVLLTAEPGAGKSAFMAQLATDNHDWPRYFIRRDQREPLADVGTHSFLLRIGYQLVAIYPEVFAEENLRIAIEQRIGEVEKDGEVIGAEVAEVLASPFHKNIIQIQQHVMRNKGKITGLRIKELVIDPHRLDINNLQYMALIDPARALLKKKPKQQIVILVDALDEIRYHGTQEHILKWLTNCPALPKNVRFVLTSRPPQDELTAFCTQKEACVKQLTIDPQDDHVQGDLETYVNNLLRIKEVATGLRQINKGAEGFLTEAVNKADGNIGYLDALARGIDQALSLKEEGVPLLKDLLSLESLPEELHGLYGFFLGKIKSTFGEQSVRVKDNNGKENFLSAWTELCRPILGILSVAFEPLTSAQIRSLGDIIASRDEMKLAMKRLLQFLDHIGNKYRFYHATVPEFLTSKKTEENAKTEDLFVESIEWHKKIANHYWSNYHNKAVSENN